MEDTYICKCNTCDNNVKIINFKNKCKRVRHVSSIFFWKRIISYKNNDNDDDIVLGARANIDGNNFIICKNCVERLSILKRMNYMMEANFSSEQINQRLNCILKYSIPKVTISRNLKFPVEHSVKPAVINSSNPWTIVRSRKNSKIADTMNIYTSINNCEICGCKAFAPNSNDYYHICPITSKLYWEEILINNTIITDINYPLCMIAFITKTEPIVICYNCVKKRRIYQTVANMERNNNSTEEIKEKIIELLQSSKKRIKTDISNELLDYYSNISNKWLSPFKINNLSCKYNDDYITMFDETTEEPIKIPIVL